MKKVTKAIVEEAAGELESRGLLADDSPDLDGGRRSAERWLAAIQKDMGIIRFNLENTLREGENKPQLIALALKEARRLEDDIYRFASEVHGISRGQIG